MPKAARCECPEHACANVPAEPKYVRCRPCAVGWHLKAPCTDYLAETFPQILRTCHRCGYRNTDH